MSLLWLKRNGEFDLKNIKLNWFLQIKNIFFERIDRVNVLENATAASFLENKISMLNLFKEFLVKEDINKKCLSSSLSIYANLELRKDVQKYLKIKMPLKFHQLISQIRLKKMKIKFLFIILCRQVTTATLDKCS